MTRLKWVLVLGLAVAAALRLPSVFEPYSYADEGIYLVLGQGFRKGLTFYRDIHDNKPPLIYITAGLAQTLTNFRLALWLVNAVNVWLVWLLARRLYNDKLKPVAVATVSFALLSSITLFEGNIANGELFMIMPFTAAVYLVWLGVKRKRWRYFLASGMLAAIAFLYKVPVGFDLVGVGLWLLWDKVKLKKLLALAAGFLGINLAVIAYYFKVGVGERYLISALLQNVSYLTSWSGGGGGSIWQIGLVQRLAVLMVLVAGVFYFRKKLHRVTAFLALWFGFGVYGALLSERPYPHYWVQVLPALSLMAGWAVGKKAEAKKLLTLGLLLIGLAWAYFRFWIYPVGAYYANFINWVVGAKDGLSYQRYWGEQVIYDRQVAEFVRQHTDSDDKIFVWGTAPGVYYLSNRLPVGRYTVAYHVADFDGYQETLKALEQEEPRVIVRLSSETLEFEGLDGLLASDYLLTETFGDRQVYLRLIE